MSSERDAVTTSRDRAIMAIRNLILRAELKPGQRVTEVTVAERLGISRTPVREAFRELVQMQLLVSEPYKGVRVAEVDLASIRQTYELRATLEPLAARLAARRITDDEVARLRALNGELRQCRHRVDRCAAINDDFHRTVAQASRNELLVDFIDDLRSRTRSFRIAFHYHPALIEESFQEHEAVIVALAQRAPRAARQAMRRHMKIAVEVLGS